ncbi:MAG TPA: hypothetical protein VLG28_00195 [Acidimicrobiia bacterium]|nr:hypothetical protein [Acidimicrobiia bacterium]
MSVLDWFRRPRLVPIAEFDDADRAGQAWTLLHDAGIPASIDTDPGALGTPRVSRVMVEEPNIAAAQQVVAALLRDETRGGAS